MNSEFKRKTKNGEAMGKEGNEKTIAEGGPWEEKKKGIKRTRDAVDRTKSCPCVHDSHKAPSEIHQ
jgi:hypothetical protein